jgi:hypothetical protein
MTDKNRSYKTEELKDLMGNSPGEGFYRNTRNQYEYLHFVCEDNGIWKVIFNCPSEDGKETETIRNLTPYAFKSYQPLLRAQVNSDIIHLEKQMQSLDSYIKFLKGHYK